MTAMSNRFTVFYSGGLLIVFPFEWFTFCIAASGADLINRGSYTICIASFATSASQTTWPCEDL